MQEHINEDSGVYLPCSCCEEMAITLMKLIQNRHSNGTGHVRLQRITTFTLTLLSSYDIVVFPIYVFGFELFVNERFYFFYTNLLCDTR